MLTEKTERVSLYFREGSSDKVYTASLEKRGAGWVVTFAYGRRGSTMNTGTKTSTPVEFEKAKKIYDKLVAEKTGKGYTPGEDGAVYTHTSSEARDTGVRCQLLNEMSDEELEARILDPLWGAQEKMDGRRQLVQRGVEGIIGINRKGLIVTSAQPIVNSLAELEGDVTIDGEAVGDMLYAFDILGLEHDLRDLGYLQRYEILKSLELKGAIKIVPLVTGTAAKRALVDRVREEGGEGVVFKRLDALYTAGRPDSGGNALKFKFYATGSFIVSRVNQKRSVALNLADGTAVGNVTIPPNKAIPALGQIVEVRYLYCFKGGSLYQPTFLEVRTDLELSDCSIRQLKFKADDTEEDA